MGSPAVVALGAAALLLVVVVVMRTRGAPAPSPTPAPAPAPSPSPFPSPSPSPSPSPAPAAGGKNRIGLFSGPAAVLAKGGMRVATYRDVMNNYKAIFDDGEGPLGLAASNGDCSLVRLNYDFYGWQNKDYSVHTKNPTLSYLPEYRTCGADINMFLEAKGGDASVWVVVDSNWTAPSGSTLQGEVEMNNYFREIN